MTSNFNKKHIYGNFEVFKELYKIYCIYNYDINTEVGNTLYQHVNLHAKNIRKEVVEFLNNNTDIVDISTDIYANKLSLYYSLK